MTLKKDFVITELMLYPYLEIKNAVLMLSSTSEPLTAEDIRFVHTQIVSTLTQHDEPEAPLSALRHLKELLCRQLSQCGD